MEKQVDTFITINQINLKQRTSILSSMFSDDFAGVRSDNIYLLSNIESERIWTTYIDKSANSFFRLPDENWLITSKRSIIGEWMENYNASETKRIENLLNSEFPNLQNDSITWFCLNKNSIIESQWIDFKTLWINFLQCEDDCPILLNSSQLSCAIIFRPVGDILKIGDR